MTPPERKQERIVLIHHLGEQLDGKSREEVIDLLNNIMIPGSYLQSKQNWDDTQLMLCKDQVEPVEEYIERLQAWKKKTVDSLKAKADKALAEADALVAKAENVIHIPEE